MKCTIQLLGDPEIMPHHFHVHGSGRETYFETDKGAYVSFDKHGNEKFKGRTRNFPNKCRVGKYYLEWWMCNTGEKGCCLCC